MNVKHIYDIEAVPTSHGCGMKRVLVDGAETASALTQMALTTLAEGECVEQHVHPTMDEFFVVRRGMIRMTVDGEMHDVGADMFVSVEAGEPHSMEALTDSELISVGCAVVETK